MFNRGVTQSVGGRNAKSQWLSFIHTRVKSFHRIYGVQGTGFFTFQVKSQEN